LGNKTANRDVCNIVNAISVWVQSEANWGGAATGFNWKHISSARNVITQKAALREHYEYSSLVEPPYAALSFVHTVRFQIEIQPHTTYLTLATWYCGLCRTRENRTAIFWVPGTATQLIFHQDGNSPTKLRKK